MVLGMRVKRSMGTESETGHSGMKYTHYLNRDMELSCTVQSYSRLTLFSCVF